MSRVRVAVGFMLSLSSLSSPLSSTAVLSPGGRRDSLDGSEALHVTRMCVVCSVRSVCVCVCIVGCTCDAKYGGRRSKTQKRVQTHEKLELPHPTPGQRRLSNTRTQLAPACRGHTLR